jgi:histidinol dehydrogenase
MPTLDPEVQAAFDVAYDNIHKFHQAQKQQAPLVVETMPGVVCRRVSRPVGKNPPSVRSAPSNMLYACHICPHVDDSKNLIK